MVPISIQKIKEATGGFGNYPYKYKTPAVKVETDTREDLENALFIALKGPNFDGHDFIGEAFNKGAACVISEREEDLRLDRPVIKVDSTYKALMDLAKAYIADINIPIVAITGSVGKTITKDMTASVLSTKYKTFKTEGNFNNEIGLPMSVLKLDNTYQAAVFELGMRGHGEIRKLADIIKPDICVITNIGYAHIENLGSREGIFKAKSEILEFQKPSGRIILNGDDDMLFTLKDSFKNIKYYGFGDSNFFRADSIREDGLWGVSCYICYEDTKLYVKVPMPGRHMVQNALAAAGAGWALGLDPSSIKNGIEHFRPSKQRMDIISADGGITIINDTYNASPASMIAAIDVLSTVKARKVCILGDMLELGERAPGFHYDVGAHAIEKGIDCLLCVGEHAGHMYKAASDLRANRQETAHFASLDELTENLGGYIREGDMVLVKASRALGFESVVEQLKVIGN